jgi:FAD/FMN-containing dehydrogenase
VSHTSPLSDFKVAAMGGAIARVGETETACPHRDAPFVLNVNTRGENPAETEHHIRHTRALFEEARSASAGGVYANFLGDEGTERIEHAYRNDTFTRLQALKRQWDPDNIFHINHNIPPA